MQQLTLVKVNEDYAKFLNDIILETNKKYKVKIYVKHHCISLRLNEGEKPYLIPFDKLNNNISPSYYRNISKTAYDLIGSKSVSKGLVKAIRFITKKVYPESCINWRQTQIFVDFKNLPPDLRKKWEF